MSNKPPKRPKPERKAIAKPDASEVTAVKTWLAKHGAKATPLGTFIKGSQSRQENVAGLIAALRVAKKGRE